MPSFASRFKQNELSDCDLLIQVRLPDTAADEEPSRKRARIQGPESPQQVTSFPAHKVILSSSEYFFAQVQNWQSTSSTTEPSSSQQRAQSDRLKLTLTIASADDAPAAEAVIAGLYGVENPFSGLQHDQLVQALIIADMIDATESAEQASKCLKTAAASQHGLSHAALNILAGLAAWPQCLQQLLPVLVANASCCKLRTADLAAVLAADTHRLYQRILLSVLGDLQAVWRDENLKDMLMQLPCAAMQLLLSSDQLRVPSEDIVVYTGQRWFSKQQGDAARTLAKSALAKLVRAPYLSEVLLQYVVLSRASTRHLMNSHLPQLSQLISIRRTLHIGSERFQHELALMAEAPSSWQLGQRQLVPALHANLVWRLPVQQLRDACTEAFNNNAGAMVVSPNAPPVSGFACSMVIHASRTEDGVRIDIGPRPSWISDHFNVNIHCAIRCNGILRQDTFDGVTRGHGQSWVDFLGVKSMSGGWDEAAWVAKGLPTTGDLVLEFVVFSVS